MGPLPSGDNLLVLVDYYNRFVKVDIVRSTTTDVIIDKLDCHFARHGLPHSIRSDNGPQFVSSQFTEYLEETGIEHRRTTPLWPRANGEVERQNRSLLKAIKVAQVENKSWKRELQTFLLAYRTTPHATTGQTPAELLFRRSVRTKLPALLTMPDGASDEAMRDRDASKKLAAAEHADRRNHATEQTTEVGDSVLLQRPARENKLDSTYLPSPHKVVQRHADQVIVESPAGQLIRRNGQYTKPYVQAENGDPLMSPPPQAAEVAEPAEPTSATTPTVSARPRHSIRAPQWLDDYARN